MQYNSTAFNVCTYFWESIKKIWDSDFTNTSNQCLLRKCSKNMVFDHDFFQYIPIAQNNGTVAFTSNYEWIEDFSSEYKKSYSGLNQCNLKKFGKNLNFMRS